MTVGGIHCAFTIPIQTHISVHLGTKTLKPFRPDTYKYLMSELALDLFCSEVNYKEIKYTVRKRVVSSIDFLNRTTSTLILK